MVKDKELKQMANPWQDIIRNPLGKRLLKPRNKGVTMVIDKGLGLTELADLLEMGSQYLDFLKLGFGTSVLYSESLLKRKIELCRRYNVHIYPGGTLMEIAYLQGHYESFLQRALHLGFEMVEISDGTISLGPQARQYCIKSAAGLGLRVITEVGKKCAYEIPTMAQLLEQSREDLETGAWKVIVESRESGRGIGIYDQEGKILKDKLEEFSQGTNDLSDIIWEAPLKNQQVELILRFGPGVNLGNIQPQDLISLETLRTGLRGDTLRMVVPQEITALAGN